MTIKQLTGLTITESYFVIYPFLFREWKKELMKEEQSLTLIEGGEKKPKIRPNLTAAIKRVFWVEYLLQGLLVLFQSAVLRIIQPILQGWVVDYFNPVEHNPMTRSQVLIYTGYLIIVTLGIVFITHHTGLRTRQIGMRVRVACCSLIYRKVKKFGISMANPYVIIQSILCPILIFPSGSTTKSGCS